MTPEQMLRAIALLQKRLDRLEARQRVNPMALYYRSSNQSITSGVLTIIDFDTMIADPRACVTTGASWVYTSQLPGLYLVEAAAMLAGSTGWVDTEAAHLSIYKGGVDHRRLFYRNDFNSASNITAFLFGSALIYLDEGDTMNIRIAQSSGGALNVLGAETVSRVGIFKVGEP